VQRASREVRTAREQVAVARGAVGQAEERLRITRDRYESGLTTIVDLLAAEAALVDHVHRVDGSSYLPGDAGPRFQVR